MNFLRIFIPNLAEHLREMTNMLNKDNEVKWSEEARKSFHAMKLALTTTPVLIILHYIDDFIRFSFASEHTMVAILMQKGIKPSCCGASKILSVDTNNSSSTRAGLAVNKNSMEDFLKLESIKRAYLLVRLFRLVMTLLPHSCYLPFLSFEHLKQVNKNKQQP